MFNYNKKGVVLFIVIGVIIIVTALATVILRVISSQSRLTHHQVGRIQGLYTGKAGMIYALEQLRLGAWKFSPNSCPNPAGCPVSDPNFPNSVNAVKVIFCPKGANCVGSSFVCNPPVGTDFCINTVVDYTHTP